MNKHLASVHRELAEIHFRRGDYLQASASHMKALLLEAGCADGEPIEPARVRELEHGR